MSDLQAEGSVVFPKEPLKSDNKKFDASLSQTEDLILPSKEKLLEFLNIDDRFHNIDLITQIIQSGIGLINDHADRGELKMLNSCFKEMRYSLKVFLKYQDTKKISIFGSARTPESNPSYLLTKKFSKLMSQLGYMIITGAASGIMKAGHEGAGRKMSFGVNIRLPFEQKANWIIKNDPKLITYKYFFVRKLFFMKESYAIVLFPGGFGTLDEGYEALTLMQTGKARLLPIVMIAPPGNTYWHDWLSFVKKHMLRKELIHQSDLSFFKITSSVAEARDEILRFYRVYHSMRFVGTRLVIRTNVEVSDSLIQEISEEFEDIIDSGQIQKGKALREEYNEKDIVHLPRLIFYFDRRSYGRLRQMINKLNNAQAKNKKSK
ncbi:MAG: LOG family protein [Chlamydiota bacterium]|nr:LOG family protein [Chlamydiota bacterium]